MMKSFYLRSLLILQLLFLQLTITSQCNLGFEWSQTNCTQYGVCDGSITVWVPGGTAPYSFGIDDGILDSLSVNDTIYTFTGLCPGSYDVYVWDQTITPCDCFGCGAGTMTTVTISDGTPVLTAQAELSYPYCLSDMNDGYYQISFSGEAPPFEVSVDGGFSWFVSSSPYVEFPFPCMSMMNVLIRDATGQIANPSLTVIPSPCQAAPVSNYTIVNDCDGACQGRFGVSVPAANWGPNPPYMITIESLGAGIAETLYVNLPTDTAWFENLCAMPDLVYNLENVAGCKYLSPTGVPIGNNSSPATPTITANGPTTICSGSSVTLSSSETNGNVWSTGETTQDINVSSAGTYSVTYTNGSGCTATSLPTTISLNTNPTVPIVTPNGNLAFCLGDSVGLTASYPLNIVWSTGQTTQSIDVLSAGTFTVTYTDGNGCAATSSSVTTTVNPLPTVVFGAIATVCNYTPSFTLTEGTPTGGSYSGTGVSSGVFDPFVAGIGNHTITYEYTDVNGCLNTATTDILVDGCLAVEQNQGTEIKVYPNPVNDKLFIEFQGDFSYEITDLNGRLISTGKGVDKQEINSSEFKFGVYLITLKNKEFTTTFRFVKNK